MPGVAIVTLILVFVLVAALALYLTVIAYCLKRVNFCLGTVLIGVRSIAYQTAPVGTVVSGIAEDVLAIEHALEDVVAGASQPAPPARTSGRTPLRR